MTSLLKMHIRRCGLEIDDQQQLDCGSPCTPDNLSPSLPHSNDDFYTASPQYPKEVYMRTDVCTLGSTKIWAWLTGPTLRVHEN